MENTISKSRMNNPIGFLSSFVLKILACIFMAIDHIGFVLFPNQIIFRIIGRLAFPLFAFFIAEGCHYSKNKIKRFLLIFVMGLAYLLFYYVYTKTFYVSIFITFSFSIFFIYLLMDIKKKIFEKKLLIGIPLFILLVLLLIGTYFIFDNYTIDYGFAGMLVPVIISLFDFKNMNVPKILKYLDNYLVRLICLALSLIGVCMTASLRISQPYCFLALIPLIFYSGKIGYSKLKYGFYAFYPIHLVIIEGISMII